MNKEEVLNEELKKYPNHMSENMTPEAVDVMMVLFHIGRLKEVGAVSVETHTITGHGFDLAMDLFEKGWVVNILSIFDTLNDIFVGQDNVQFTGLIHKTQSYSIAELKAIEKSLEKDD